MRKSSLYIALFVAFIDLMGVGLVYPIFSSMLFDPETTMLSPGASARERGALLALLLALTPLVQFFSAPIWGALSDSKGRKTPLLFSIAIGVTGYITAVGAIFWSSIVWLLASRVIIGFASGNMSIVQAAVADLSSAEEKTKNFGLYSMSLGAGFTLGPFFGGWLAGYGNVYPFLFALLIVILNFAFVSLVFQETHHSRFPRRLSWRMGIDQFKNMVQFHEIRTVLFSFFFHHFGWSFFFEFGPVYLISRFGFTAPELGMFYGMSGIFYALCTGLLIRPFIKRIKPQMLYPGGMLLAALAILMVAFLPSSVLLWPLLFFICFFMAFVSPTANTLVSNGAAPAVQGEALGLLGSMNAAALVLCPLFSSAFIGAHPSLTIWVSGTTMTLTATAVFAIWCKKTRDPRQ
jgi:MFS transporter, DHA1 family, tetracycline resistance protein